MAQDFIAIRGQSLLVLTDAIGPWCNGAFDTLEPVLLDAWDALLDSRDAAHEGPDGKLATA